MQTYRPDIDGLRTIAVLSVLLFHVGIEGFAGGYVGVDIFFVISGYLITRNIVSETKNNRFSFGSFYIRRARRLLPAFFFTVAVTFILGAVLLSPQHFERLSSSAVYSIFSTSNFLFWSESGYFDIQSELKPLLHTWSLSVEEQFYLIWPALILFTLHRGSYLYLKIAAIVLFLLSLITSEVLLSKDAEASFFLLPSRVFEFAVGAFVAVVPQYRKNHSWTAEILLVLGLSLMLYSILTFNAETAFPGLYALIPCLGAALTIYAGNPKHLGIILRNPLSVKIGLISYSLYLAHWPIYVYYKYYVDRELNLNDKLSIIALCFLGAIVMHRYIEQPFRRGEPSSPYTKNKKFLVGTAFSAALVLIPAVHAANYNGWTWRIPNEVLEVSNSITQGYPLRKEALQCLKDKSCDKKTGLNVVIIGDSYAEDYALMLQNHFEHINVDMITMDGCKALLHFKDKRWKKSKVKRCKNYSEQALSLDFSLYDAVVIGHSWSFKHLKPLDKTLKSIKEKNNNIVLFGPKITLKKRPSETISRVMSVESFKAASNKELQYKQYISLNTELRSISHRNDVIYIDLGALQGNDSFTNVTNDLEVVFYDQGHLTTAGVELLSDRFKQIYPNVLAQK